jgi:hypothetical protein
MKDSFSKKIFSTLQQKVEDHNEKHSRQVTVDELVMVYKRGEKITSSIFRPLISVAHWAMARVNLFLSAASERPVQELYQGRDRDILEERSITHRDEASEFFWRFRESDLTIARTELLLGGITDDEANQVFIPPLEVDKNT